MPQASNSEFLVQGSQGKIVACVAQKLNHRACLKVGYLNAALRKWETRPYSSAVKHLENASTA